MPSGKGAGYSVRGVLRFTGSGASPFTGMVTQRWRRGGSRAGPAPSRHPQQRVQARLDDRRRHVADGRGFTVCKHSNAAMRANIQT